MLLIKRVIIVYFSLSLFGFAWVFWMLHSTPDIDLIILEKATIQKSSNDTRSENLMRWLSQKKLKHFGFTKKCFFNALQQDINGSAIDTLLAFYMENKSINKTTVLNLISDFSKLGCTINDQGVGGFTPLHQAIIGGESELVELLLALGADASTLVRRKIKGSKTNGMNAVALTEYLINISGGGHKDMPPIEALIDILNKLKNNQQLILKAGDI